MLMYGIAHGGCMDTVRESALKLTQAKKSLASVGTQTHMSIVPGFLEQLLTELTLPLE